MLLSKHAQICRRDWSIRDYRHIQYCTHIFWYFLSSNYHRHDDITRFFPKPGRMLQAGRASLGTGTVLAGVQTIPRGGVEKPGIFARLISTCFMDIQPEFLQVSFQHGLFIDWWGVHFCFKWDCFGFKYQVFDTETWHEDPGREPDEQKKATTFCFTPSGQSEATFQMNL